MATLTIVIMVSYIPFLSGTKKPERFMGVLNAYQAYCRLVLLPYVYITVITPSSQSLTTALVATSAFS